MAAINVVEFPYGETLRNSPAKLRLLADQIEAGKYGAVSCVGVALLGDSFECFGYGDGIHGESVAPSVAMLFSAGHLRLIREIEQHGAA